jgi:hypothetical protein
MQYAWGAACVSGVELVVRLGLGLVVRHVMMGGEGVLRDWQVTKVNEQEVAEALSAHLHSYTAETLRQRNAAAVALEPYLRRFYASWESSAPQRQMFF